MRDGAAMYINFIDHITWPTVWKLYAKADPEHFGTIDAEKFVHLCFEGICAILLIC